MTSRIRLGTGICLVAQRDPIVTAKEVATLDLVSGDRFDFGIGVGWNEDEATNHGVDFRRRRALVREQILAMQRLWSDDVASFEGELVHLPPSWAWPKPVQRPRPPILIGGAARAKGRIDVLWAHVSVRALVSPGRRVARRYTASPSALRPQRCFSSTVVPGSESVLEQRSARRARRGSGRCSGAQ